MPFGGIAVAKTVTAECVLDLRHWTEDLLCSA